MKKEFYTPAEVAELLGVTYATALRWIKYDSKIPFVKIGRSYRIRVDVFEKFTSTEHNKD